MITCDLLGGLGNQLFQIFTTISYSFDCEQPFGFSDSYETKGITNRTTYWGSFLLNFEPQTHRHLPTEWEYIKEAGFQYNELPIKTDSGNKKIKYILGGLVIIVGACLLYYFWKKSQKNTPSSVVDIPKVVPSVPVVSIPAIEEVSLPKSVSDAGKPTFSFY
jgi:hypothetical protein